VIYIIAVQSNHVLAASLGYYINPLLNVLLGTVFLREKLSRLQWLAVAIAAVGVASLAWGARDMLFISLSLAGSFALYGLVRKLAPVGSLPGLTTETLLLTIPAIAVLTFYGMGEGQLHFGNGSRNSWILAGSGIATAVPLLLFAVNGLFGAGLRSVPGADDPVRPEPGCIQRAAPPNPARRLRLDLERHRGLHLGPPRQAPPRQGAAPIAARGGGHPPGGQGASLSPHENSEPQRKIARG
jgi:hypothetical protein